MSVFSGRQGKGAMRAHRSAKRTQAEARDAALPAASPKRRDVRRTIDRLEQALTSKGPRP